jgi:predicted nucleotidyltransferase
MQKLLDQLVAKLREAMQDRLVSVVLYGSAVTGDHQPKFSDYNVLCVLSALARRELAASEPIFRWWREQGSPAPLLLTEREVETCTDCFAIEFHDIQRNHRVLYGKDVVSQLAIDDSFYRAQIEHDLRAKLLRLRQKASGMLSDPDLLRRLLLDSISTFCVLFRHALILHDVAAPERKREVIQAAREHFAIDAAPFEKLLDIREERIKPREVDPVSLLDPYMQGVTVVIDAVDRLEKV